MRKKMICILAAALIVSATAAFGAVKEGSFSVTPLVGGYIYADDQHLDPSLVVGARAGYNFTKIFGVEALYDYVTRTDSSTGPLTDISMHRFGAQGLYHFFPDNVLVPYLAAGYSGVKFNGAGIDHTTHGAFDYGAGVKYFLTDDIAVRGDVRHILYQHNPTINNLEFSLGAYFQFGAEMPVMKAVTPPPAPEPVKVVPAPAPEPVPAPVVVPPADSDNDGVIDALDKCPGTPAGVTVDSNGCPVDSDKDGVPDYLDKCPGTPAGAVVDANGCVVETAKRFCDKPAIMAVSFDANKAEIKAKYHDELDKLGNFLKEFPSSKGTIEGHTDSDGSKEANLKLSQARAESVRSYIINKFGIDGSRISAKGHGSAKPVASNKSAAGKAKNRRIEAIFSCE
jgi:OOP family OmpA-OmpF porin